MVNNWNSTVIDSIKSYNALQQEQRISIIDNYLGEFIEATKELGKFSREIVFEEIRANFFPNLPSRRSGIWLCHKNAVQYWYNEISGNKTIVKLNVTGRCHIGDQRHLVLDLFSHNQLRNFAFNYWTGTDNENPEEIEILFEGILNIVDVYKTLDEFKLLNS